MIFEGLFYEISYWLVWSAQRYFASNHLQRLADCYSDYPCCESWDKSWVNLVLFEEDFVFQEAVGIVMEKCVESFSGNGGAQSFGELMEWAFCYFFALFEEGSWWNNLQSRFEEGEGCFENHGGEFGEYGAGWVFRYFIQIGVFVWDFVFELIEEMRVECESVGLACDCDWPE